MILLSYFLVTFFASQVLWYSCPSDTVYCKIEDKGNGVISQKLTLTLEPKNLLLGKPVHIFGEDTRKKVPKKNLNKIPYRWTARVVYPVKERKETVVSTGVLVGPCHLLITGHATIGASEFYINFQNGQTKTKGILIKKGNRYNKETLKNRKVNDDWAILKLEKCMPKGYGCPIFPSMNHRKFFYEKPYPALQMTSYNYKGKDKSISKDELVYTKKCRMVTFLDPHNKDPYKNLGLNNCPVQSGTSGSPLFSTNNELVGIQIGDSKNESSKNKKNKGVSEYVPEWGEESIYGGYHNYFSHYGALKEHVNSVTENQKGCSDRFPSEYK